MQKYAENYFEIFKNLNMFCINQPAHLYINKMTDFDPLNMTIGKGITEGNNQHKSKQLYIQL